MKDTLIDILEKLKDKKTHIVVEVHGHNLRQGDVIFFAGDWITLRSARLERTRFHLFYDQEGFSHPRTAETNTHVFMKKVII